MEIRITGSSEDFAVLLMTLMDKEKNSPKGEHVGKFIDEEYLKQITVLTDRPRAKRDNP